MHIEKEHRVIILLGVFTQFVYDKHNKKKNKVNAMFFNLKTACDTIFHDKLVSKVFNNFKLEPSFVKILCNNRNNSCKGSKYCPILCNVQASALGPI
jgi:hypothetical protein